MMASVDCAVTVTFDVPGLPSLVAVITTSPEVTPVTRPADDTVATCGSALDQVTLRPLSGWPAVSLGVAVSCTVLPAATVGAAGGTSTEATGPGGGGGGARARPPLPPPRAPVFPGAPPP